MILTHCSSVDVRLRFTMTPVFQSISKGIHSIQTYCPVNGKPYNMDFESAIWPNGDTGASSVFDKSRVTSPVGSNSNISERLGEAEGCPTDCKMY